MIAPASRTHRDASEAASSVGRDSLRLSAILLVAGEVVSIGAGILHPSREDANNHPAVFAEYANSTIWTAIHIGQFVGMAMVLGGLLVLISVLRFQGGLMGAIRRLGTAAAGAALALYAVLQAVDGVALKRAVNAWANSADAEKAARFATAEGIRWLEEAVRSYQSFAFGVALLLVALVIIRSATPSHVIGYLMGLSGLAYITQGWLLGEAGFARTLMVPQLLGYALVIVWSVWLLIIAVRMSDPSGTGAVDRSEPVRTAGSRESAR